MFNLNKVIKVVTILALFFSNVIYAQQYNCGNVGFENGVNTGWSGYVGTCVAGPVGSPIPSLQISSTPVSWTTPQYYTSPSTFPPQVRFTIVTADSVKKEFFDPIISTIPLVSPWGGKYSLKLGNEKNSSLAEKVSFNYTVDATNANFVYQYAVILQNPSHNPNEQPAFRIRITNSSGIIINSACGVYNVAAGQTGAGFSSISVPTYGILSYRNWSLSSIDLTSFIGQTVTIEFATNDCSQGAHFGYAYIDCSCVPLAITTSYCSGALTADASGPDGYVSYSWTGDQSVNYPPANKLSIPPITAGPIVPAGNVITTNQKLLVPTSDTLTKYEVECIPYQGKQCATKLSYIFNPKPTIKTAFSYVAYCGNTPSVFTEKVKILNGGSPATSWFWNFGDGTTSTLKSPNHKFPILNVDTSYIVSLLVQAGTSCKDTAIDTIKVPAGLKIDTIGNAGIYNVTCNGFNDGKAIFNVSGASGDSIYYYWTLPNPPGIKDSAAYGIVPNSATNNLFPVYKFVAKASGCSDSVSFIINEPPPIVASVDTNYISCKNKYGTLSAKLNGGTGSLSTVWDVSPPQYGATANGLIAGKYSLTVIDSNGCSIGAMGVLLDGSLLKHRLHITPPSCHGLSDGSVSIKLYNGKPPYSIVWHISKQPIDSVPKDTSYFSGLFRSNNYVILHNDNGCDNDTVPFSITEPDTLLAILTISNASCFEAANGTIKTDAVGGVQPYKYYWNTQHDPTINAIKNLEQGIYSVKITDANNCVIQKVGTVGYDSNLVVTAKPDFVYDEFAKDNSLWVTVNKPGTYKYNWNNENELDNSTIATPTIYPTLFAMEFRVDVEDEYGCKGFDSVKVDVLPVAYIPNAVTPNGDGNNDFLEIILTNYEIKDFTISVFDRWGEVVFVSHDPKFKWDCKYTNAALMHDTYNYQITYTNSRNKRQNYKGLFTIIR